MSRLPERELALEPDDRDSVALELRALELLALEVLDFELLAFEPVAFDRLDVLADDEREVELDLPDRLTATFPLSVRVR